MTQAIVYSEQLDEEFAAKLAPIAEEPTSEEGHASADDILCDLLRQLGFTKTVAAFDAIGKWYA